MSSPDGGQGQAPRGPHTDGARPRSGRSALGGLARPGVDLAPLGRGLAVLAVAFLGLVAAGGLSAAVYAGWLFHDLPDAGDLRDYRPPTATRVYAWDATLIGEFSDERRIFTPYDQLPPLLVRAFLAAEDRNFFQHGGVDVTGFSRAMLNNVSNLAKGRRLEGGSTITQQVAKNVLLNNDATVGRKLKEAILAQRLERVLSKESIVELYLNEIYLGYRSYGVGSAAFNYFRKPLSELSLAEIAYLASLPKGPHNYHPVRNKAAAMARRNWVLGQMAELGWVSAAEAREAMAQDLVAAAGPARASYADADYFVEEVRRRGLDLFGKGLNSDGLYMRTTLDPKLQTHARAALMTGLESYDRRHGWRGAWGVSDLPDGWAGIKVPRAPRDSWRAARVTAAGGAVRLELAPDRKAGEDGAQQGETVALAGEDVAWARAGKGLAVDHLVFVEPVGGAWRLRQIPRVNGALVALEPQTGRVVAMVGGYSYRLSAFNRATQAQRQPGSSFKPFVYAAALADKYTPASTVMDSAISFANWSPENYNRRYMGALTLRRGLELSRNTMTVRLAQNVGMKPIRKLAIDAGVTDQMEPVLAMALGAGETTPFRMAGAYATFLNGGRKVEPHLIELVQDREGKTVRKADRRDCRGCGQAFRGEESPRIAPAGPQLLDPIVAYEVTSMMEGVVQRGTATAAGVLGPHIGGKTGTTNEYRSAWFVGFSSDLVVATYIGFDDNRSLGEGETGGVAALPIFIDFMREALKDRPARSFTPPKDAKIVTVRGIPEAFRPGSEPRVRVATAPAGGGGSPLQPRGPIPYAELAREPAAPAPAAPPAAAPPPARREEGVPF